VPVMTMSADACALPVRFTPHALAERLPRHLAGKPDTLTEGAWCAAAWILTLFGPQEPRIWDYVEEFFIDFDAILSTGGWSSRELLLLRTAASLSGTTFVSVDLSDLAALLDAHDWHTVLEALRIRRTGEYGGSR
jgi:hypothetical protein